MSSISFHKLKTLIQSGELSLSETKIIILTTCFVMAVGNSAFYNRLLSTYPLELENVGFLISIIFFIAGFISLFLLIGSLFVSVRLVSGLFILLTVVAGYYADNFGIIIDAGMIGNTLDTNHAEMLDLITLELVLRVIVLGILPVWFLSRLKVDRNHWLRKLRYKAQMSVMSMGFILLSVLLFGDHYASFIREHKSIRYYVNPVYPVYSIVSYIVRLGNESGSNEFNVVLENVGTPDNDKERELIILVVGETARADHFSLNGYKRQTNPYLSQEIENIISYENVSSCGTSTAHSLPCMFSFKGRKSFDLNASAHTENVLDVLKKSGVNVLWRDNNSSSKGVADRVEFEGYRSKKKNHYCDVECRDIGMLDGLQDYIDSRDGDILVVLHQMGSHGPAYFKRYPEEFGKYKPACHTKELSKCSREEITNAYDNTILYTDYFLSKVIDLLKTNANNFETSMLYVSDHGESLGEHGVYLHGLPYFIAPESQTHVPLIVWAGGTSDISVDMTVVKKNTFYSHDDLANALLSLFEIEKQKGLITESEGLVNFKSKGNIQAYVN